MSNEKINQEPDKEIIDGTKHEGSQRPSTEVAADTEQSADVNLADDPQAEGDTSSKFADEVALWKDRFVRLSAEFDNYRKRTLKEKMELVATASEDVIKSLLPVLDDFDRALNVLENNEVAPDAFGEGMILIYMKFKDTLRGKGLVEIESIGKPLDTDLHDAIAKVPVEKRERGKIVDVALKGYMLNDKVIRHAKVVVGE